jgi:multidrug efflux pump subunit AcrA (membrane-fusion protein)
LRRLAAAALLALGCGRGQPAAAPAGAAPPPVRVVRGALEDRFVLGGELKAVASEDLVAPRTPTWTVSVRWLAPDGAHVKKGDRVVEFDASSFASALGDKRLAVVRAAGELDSETAKAATEVSDKKMEVQRKRAELDKARAAVNVDPDLYPRRQFQEKQLDLQRAQDALAKAQEDLASQRRVGALDGKVKTIALERAERELKELSERLDSLVLRAPRDGLVQIGDNPREGRKFLLGDTTYPGWPVATMPDTSKMQVQAQLHDVDDGAIRVGMPAACVLDAYPDRVWKGTVKEVSPIARTQGREVTRRFFNVIVALDQTADLMRPGMSARVEVIRRRARDVLLVPRTAVRASGGKTLVRLLQGGDEAAQPVDIDWCTELTCVVRGGLLEGTTVRAEPPPLARGSS